MFNFVFRTTGMFPIQLFIHEFLLQGTTSNILFTQPTKELTAKEFTKTDIMHTAIL